MPNYALNLTVKKPQTRKDFATLAIRRGLSWYKSARCARRRQATPLSEPNLNRTMKARAEGEVAANPLGDLSPFSPPCVDFHFTPSLCRLHFRNSRERLCFLLRRFCGSIPSSMIVECCKTIFVPPLTSFQCSACRLLLSCIAFS